MSESILWNSKVKLCLTKEAAGKFYHESYSQGFILKAFYDAEHAISSLEKAILDDNKADNALKEAIRAKKIQFKTDITYMLHKHIALDMPIEYAYSGTKKVGDWDVVKDGNSVFHLKSGHTDTFLTQIPSDRHVVETKEFPPDDKEVYHYDDRYNRKFSKAQYDLGMDQLCTLPAGFGKPRLITFGVRYIIAEKLGLKIFEVRPDTSYDTDYRYEGNNRFQLHSEPIVEIKFSFNGVEYTNLVSLVTGRFYGNLQSSPKKWQRQKKIT